MKIHSITLSGVSSLRDQKIDLHPDLTVFTGVNGSGKSTVLRMMYDLTREQTHDQQEDRISALLNKNSQSLRASVEIDLGSEVTIPVLSKPANEAGRRGGLVQDTKTVSKLVITSGRAKGKPPHHEIKFPQHTEAVSHGGLTREGLKSSIGHIWNYSNEIGGIGNFCYISSERGRTYLGSHDSKDGAVYRAQETGERFSKVRALVDLIYNLDGQVEGILNEKLSQFFPSVVNVAKTRTKIGTKFREADLNTFGNHHELATSASGSVEVLFLVAETCTLKNSLILIDEPELHLHPIIQDYLAKYLVYLTTEQGGCNQVILSTHSLSLIYGCRKGHIYYLQKDVANPFANSHAIRICDSGTPTSGYRVALDMLGYSKESLRIANDFYQDFKHTNPDFTGRRGLWDQD